MKWQRKFNLCLQGIIAQRRATTWDLCSAASPSPYYLEFGERPAWNFAKQLVGTIHRICINI
jgi:hypothetical protein